MKRIILRFRVKQIKRKGLKALKMGISIRMHEREMQF